MPATRSRFRRALLAAAVAVPAVTATVVTAVPAAAQEPPPAPQASAVPELRGAWAPLNRCPVDDPAMLAADGAATSALCLSAAASSGSMTIGEKTVPAGRTSLQFGVLRSGAGSATVAPSGGALVAEPVPVPGGLLNLMCPSDIPVLTSLCERVAGSPLNAVTATVESVGPPAGFDYVAGLVAGRPIVALPVRIRLDNPLLGGNCYLGSARDPIVLRPRNLGAPSASVVRFAADGTLDPAGEMGYLALSGTDQGDETFSVPEANGCGLFGALDWAVNAQLGLPSPAGSNSFVLERTETAVGGFYTPNQFTPDQGRQLAQRWHAAVVR
ncbi:hypothetical protein [Prauserella muralis]|uniref:Uncharacterized protein n=1 Tax=Prauserella muralis TaxID=588067 RepID=A0A2V4AYJ0_9PSEU|nr:hypothetical protein [Prauserella muralis]PXY27081.1 hypothetical protein BAY60_11385 [Prauserella muralis]TWE23289.1 hypothetical protein FHX69_4549 [Prauserella muralis]